jgi:TonB family protein
VSKEGKVKGTVTNEKGNPLEGVAIIVQGTTTGTNTDANGDFVLKNVPSDAELVFSYIGLKSERLKPDFDHRMMVKMEISIVGVQPVNVGEDPNNYLSEGFQKDGNKTAFKGPKDQFVVVEQMPQYPGGYKAMMHFLLENVKYPPEAKAAGKEGTVVVNFLVNKRGKIKEIKTIQSVDPALDAEAVRVVNSMPDWDPGEQNGKPVDVYYSIPIQFSLKEKKSIDNAKQPGIILKDIEIPKEDPLYIIDGVIVSKDIFKKLDPATIKSVSILKNESATAPYGEKGKNGVILISTKVNLGTPQSSNSLSDIKVIGYGYGQQPPIKENQVGISVRDGKVVAINTAQPIIAIPYRKVDEKPEFPGGIREMMKFISLNVKYPVIASEGGISGPALVRFIVMADGHIGHVDVVNDIDPSIKSEASRILKKMPQWIPGKDEGKAVDVVCTIPMKFILVDQNGKTLETKTMESFSGDFEEVLVIGYSKKPQDKSSTPLLEKDKTFVNVERMPEFPGGTKELTKYIQDNLKYPREAQIQRIQGAVIIRFVVTTTGKLDQITLMRGVNPLLDEEAMRIIKSSPDWIPGEQGGKPVNVFYTIPVRFVLSPSSTSSVPSTPPPLSSEKN